ncbi:hypothetical protein GCM10023346_36840 [Arthrobacter gyeryongensis]|uniref:Uncharacterized protein n=1 Tax=Arthrobacter gyeryongensis TaxID=1650592 RepID=A0ABP9SPC2_9MICC
MVPAPFYAGALAHSNGLDCTLLDTADDPELLDSLRTAVRTARIKVLRMVNTQLIELYWAIGQGVRLQ